ncbi:hypothetical protein Hypma_004802 [Hypsizygus marmoreus]|uniref:Uncharacterized protein n=1 Tax=Hypsizygus marmoreus TaxID=39966 RepID=A0A369IZT3_HYPMA|nr:hypothetical protein Hypma_004802 [Hypsizygus marmoreus]
MNTAPSPHDDFQTQRDAILSIPKGQGLRMSHEAGELLVRRLVTHHQIRQEPIKEDNAQTLARSQEET